MVAKHDAVMEGRGFRVDVCRTESHGVAYTGS